MKSIFMLCDFGIAYNTVERLYENNIKIYDIVNNPSCLNNVLGTRSQKADDIKETINKLTEEMLAYASQMEFEKAAELRDKIKELENLL